MDFAGGLFNPHHQVIYSFTPSLQITEPFPTFRCQGKAIFLEKPSLVTPSTLRASCPLLLPHSLPGCFLCVNSDGALICLHPQSLNSVGNGILPVLLFKPKWRLERPANACRRNEGGNAQWALVAALPHLLCGLRGVSEQPGSSVALRRG